MSGSPPPEPSRDPSQLAGRRRKRSDSPTITITTTTATAATTSSIPAPTEPATQRHGEQFPSERTQNDPAMQIAPGPVPYLPPLTYGTGPVSSITQYTQPELPPAQQQVSPRSTRKTKAHVASACINCKKKHLRCDNSRPCRRCVQSGKEDTCRDVEHKKRGRPPLKPEDPTVMGRRIPGPAAFGHMPDPSSTSRGADPRGYAQPSYPPILPNAPPPMYGHGHQRAGSRSSLYSLQSPYATPSVASSSLTATGHFSYGARPHSTSSSMSSQPLSPYINQPSYGVQGAPRRMQPYPPYSFQPVEMPPATQPMYPSPLFPREQVPPQAQASSQYGHGVQLPPIRPPHQGMIDPSITQHQPPAQQTSSQGQGQGQGQAPGQRQGSNERDPKRPKMDIQGILGPKND